jgi:hypothetical protein
MTSIKPYVARKLAHKKRLLSLPRRAKKRSVLTGHNKRKLSVLLSVFNRWKSAGEVATETLPKREREREELHKRNVAKCLSRLKYGYSRPYVILGKRKKGAKVVYRASKKGRRVACELNYREKRGLSLKWGRPGYHITCARTCDECENNPTDIKIRKP